MSLEHLEDTERYLQSAKQYLHHTRASREQIRNESETERMRTAEDRAKIRRHSERDELKEERLHSRGTDASKDKPGRQTLPRLKALPKPRPAQDTSAGGAAAAAGDSGSASGAKRKEASSGWDSSCLAAAAASGSGPRAPPRTPEQVCLSSAALDALDPAADLSA